MLALLQVLAALSVRGGIGGNSHVPYRDSRLTQLLWEGLRWVRSSYRGQLTPLACLCKYNMSVQTLTTCTVKAMGACNSVQSLLLSCYSDRLVLLSISVVCRGGGRVLMLACLCPLKFAAEESINTLHFASMALRIKSVPVIMVDPQVGLSAQPRSWYSAGPTVALAEQHNALRLRGAGHLLEHWQTLWQGASASKPQPPSGNNATAAAATSHCEREKMHCRLFQKLLAVVRVN